MIEPSEHVRHKPQGAWPASFIQVHLPDSMSIEQAVYEVCELSRKMYWGVRGDLRGLAMQAMPHETTDQVVSRYRREWSERMVTQKREEAVTRFQPLPDRWPPSRKLALLNSIDEASKYAGSVQAILAKHNLTQEEVDAWRASYARHGEAGLKAGRARG